MATLPEHAVLSGWLRRRRRPCRVWVRTLVVRWSSRWSGGGASSLPHALLSQCPRCSPRRSVAQLGRQLSPGVLKKYGTLLEQSLHLSHHTTPHHMASSRVRCMVYGLIDDIIEKYIYKTICNAPIRASNNMDSKAR